MFGNSDGAGLSVRFTKSRGFGQPGGFLLHRLRQCLVRHLQPDPVFRGFVCGGFNGKLDQFPLDSKLSSDNTLGLRMLPPRIFGRLYQHLGCIWECVHSYLSIIYKLNAVFWCRRFTMVYRGDDGGLVVVSRV
jgi:hypothetical protein